MALGSAVGEIQAWTTRRVRAVALAVGVVQVAFVAVVVSTSGYFRDDFPFFGAARVGGFSQAELTRSVFGSLIPGFEAGNSILALFNPIPRWPAVLFSAVLYALILLVFYRLAEQLVGAHPALILLQVVVGFSGVLAISLVWWTAALNSLPAVLFDLVALDGLARSRTTGPRRHLVISVVAFALGVAFYDASASFLVVLVLFAALYLADGTAGWRAVVGTFTSTWWVWAGYLVPIVANFAWRQAHHAQYALPPLPTIGQALRFVATGWAQGFVPFLIGVNYQSLPSWAGPLVVVGGQLLVLGLVVATIRRRPTAGRAWIVFAGGFLALEAVASIGRASSGTTFAINTVYWAVQPFVLASMVALAFLPSRFESAPPAVAGSRGAAENLRPAWHSALVLGTLAVTLALAVAGAAAIWTSPDRSQGASSRAYMAALSSSWSTVQDHEPHPFIWNTQVPAYVSDPFFTPYNRIATTAGLLMPLRIDAASGQGYVVSPSGSLTPARVSVVSRSDHATCLTAVDRPRRVTIGLGHAVPVGNWFLRLTYRDSTGFRANLDGQSVTLGRGSGAVLLPYSLPKVFSGVTLTLPSDASACVSSAAIESPTGS